MGGKRKVPSNPASLLGQTVTFQGRTICVKLREGKKVLSLLQFIKSKGGTCGQYDDAVLLSCSFVCFPLVGSWLRLPAPWNFRIDGNLHVFAPQIKRWGATVDASDIREKPVDMHPVYYISIIYEVFF